MAIVLRSGLEGWMFQAGRFVWEQVHREPSGPSIPQLRAALVEHATAAARAETRSELTRELSGVFEAALALAAARGIARASVLADRPERARARTVLDRVAALRSTASDVLETPARARKALSDLGANVARGIERRETPEPLPRRPRARRVLDRVAELGSSVADPMAVLDRVAELGSSVVGAADPGAVLDRVADLGASVADAADRGASAVLRGAAAAIGGGDGSRAQHVPQHANASDQPKRAPFDDANPSATSGQRGPASAASPVEHVRVTILREAFAIVTEHLTTPARTSQVSITRVRAASGPWRVDAVMSRWLRLRRSPPDAAAVRGGRGAVRRVASRLFSLGHRGYDSHARFALRARWPVLRERRWFGRRQRQFKVRVEQRSKGAMLATLPASAGAQLAAWAVTTTSRFLLERWVLPYLMRKAAPLRVAPVAGRLLWGFGRVAVPTGLRLLARTPTRVR